MHYTANDQVAVDSLQEETESYLSLWQKRFGSAGSPTTKTIFDRTVVNSQSTCAIKINFKHMSEK